LVDIKTIKPGDRVKWDTSIYGNGATYQGEYVVDSPPIHNSMGVDFIRGIHPNGSSVLIYPQTFVLCDETPEIPVFVATSQTPPSCVCDLMALMRVGCQCGHMAREREAAS
jgi:hypothetical protein